MIGGQVVERFWTISNSDRLNIVKKWVRENVEPGNYEWEHTMSVSTLLLNNKDDYIAYKLRFL